MSVTKTSLALLYRPKTWSDVIEQDAIKTILAEELKEGNLKRCLLFTGPAGTGKCLGKGTKVLMYDGSVKNVEDITVGEQLMGPDSTPRTVLSLARGSERMYEIQPTRGGVPFTCNESHILSLKCGYTHKRGNKYKKDKVFNVNVKDYLKIGKSTREKILRLYRSSVDFPNQQSLEINPYIYGLWLGDGTSRNPELTSIDDVIIKEWCEYAKELDLNVHIQNVENSEAKRCRYTSEGTNHINKNKFYEVLNPSIETGHKRILHKYKTASRENRLQLLAGIIDTDGYKVSGSNTVEITSKYEDLAEDYAFIARSLGFRVSIKKKEKCKCNDKLCNAYTVRISGELSIIPCRLERKRCTKSFRDGDPLKTSFKVIDKGIGDYYGFTIDGDHLFMLGDFTVTHNTTNARIFASEIESSAVNVIEINCADHTGVDDVRDLIIQPSRVKPLVGKYKIFILDECFYKNTQIMTSSGNKNIQDVKINDEVLTMYGYQKVLDTRINKVNIDRLVCVKIDDKYTLTTKDHLFFTNKGWIEAQNLKADDIIYQCESVLADIKNIYDFNELLSNDKINESKQILINSNNICTDYQLQIKPRLIKDNIQDRGGWQFPEIEKLHISNNIKNKLAGTSKVQEVIIFNNENIELFKKCGLSDDEINEGHVNMYDLNIENCPNYFANNVLVHNCHMLTVQSQNALLKILEEPPSHCIYILCTTDPQKVLGTILSRAFRYDFQLISHQGIVDRLNHILTCEKNKPDGCGVESWEMDALGLLSTAAKGHMRDAITNCEKLLSFSKNITVRDVEKVLGITGYDILFNILNSLLMKDESQLINHIDNLVKSGMDLKLFVKNFLAFTLDVNKYVILKTENISDAITLIDIPSSYENKLMMYNASHKPVLKQILRLLVELNSSLKWETNVKPVLETQLLLQVLQ